MYIIITVANDELDDAARDREVLERAARSIHADVRIWSAGTAGTRLDGDTDALHALANEVVRLSKIGRDVLTHEHPNIQQRRADRISQAMHDEMTLDD